MASDCSGWRVGEHGHARTSVASVALAMPLLPCAVRRGKAADVVRPKTPVVACARAAGYCRTSEPVSTPPRRRIGCVTAAHGCTRRGDTADMRAGCRTTAAHGNWVQMCILESARIGRIRTTTDYGVAVPRLFVDDRGLPRAPPPSSAQRFVAGPEAPLLAEVEFGRASARSMHRRTRQAQRRAALLGGCAARRPLAQHILHRRHAAVHAAPTGSGRSAHARAARSHTCCTFSRRPPEKRSGCTRPCTTSSSSSRSRSRWPRAPLRWPPLRCASLMSSSLKIATRPRWPLTTRKSLTMPASNCGSRVSTRSAMRRLREPAHLGLALLEQVARQVEAERRLLQRSAAPGRPGLGRDQRRLLRRCGMRVAEVEQAALVGMRRLRVGPVEGQRRRWPAPPRGRHAARRTHRP